MIDNTVRWSDEHRRKQSLGLQYKRKLRENKTPSERHIEDLLNELGYHYQDQKLLIKGDFFCLADFYLPKPLKLIIEIDGGYHTNPKQQWRDHFKNEYYKSRKFKVLRITDKQALAGDAIDLENWIKNVH
jgi:very-short-patch-repair endonuclease